MVVGLLLLLFLRARVHRTGDVQVFQHAQAAEKLAALASKGSTSETVEHDIDLEQRAWRDCRRTRRAYRMVQVHQQVENEMDELPARGGFVAGKEIGNEQTYRDGHRAENEDEREKEQQAGQTDARDARGIAEAVR